MADRSADPVWFLYTRVLPHYTRPSEAEPEEDELGDLGEFVRRLRKMCSRGHYWGVRGNTDYGKTGWAVDDVRNQFNCLTTCLLEMKHHRLRAIYWEEISQVRAKFDDKCRALKWRRRTREV